MGSAYTDVRSRSASQTPGFEKREIYFFIDSRLHHCAGNWYCELQADHLFCSDVMFAVTENFNFISGTRCLIHPDDVHIVRNYINKEENKSSFDFTIRLITTYGKIAELISYNIHEHTFNESIIENIAEQTYRHHIIEKQLIAVKERDEIQLKTYSYSERILSFGISYYNTITHETYYTDGFFRLHGLPPQSLNPHFHTFSSFIYPEDKVTVIQTIEKSYELQVPVQLEYRILINNTDIRYISYSARCFYNAKGELIICGIIEDNSDSKEIDSEMENIRNELDLKSKMLKHTESMVKMANWYVNLLTRKIVYSDQIYRLYGLKPQGNPLNANALLHFVHPDDMEMMTEVNRKILYEHIAPDIVFRITRPDGKIRWLRQKGKTVINGFQELIMIGTIADITDQETNNAKIKKLKEELEIYKYSYKVTEEYGEIGNWIWNVNTGHITWSDGFYNLLGYKNNSMEMTHRILVNFIYPADRQKFTDNIKWILSDQKETDFHFRILKKGETRYIRANFRIEEIDNKKIFFGTLKDVTSTFVYQKKLSETEGIVQVFRDSSIDQVFITDINNYILKWNRVCEEEYGIKKETTIGKNIFDIFPKFKTPEILQRFQKVLNGEEIILKDSKSLITGAFQDVVMKPIRDDGGNIKAVLTIMRNVTKEYELKQQLTSRLQFIERLMESSVDRIIVLDKNMNYILWNHTAEQYYGVLKEQVIGKNILELFPGFIDDPSYTEFRNVLKGQTVHIPAIKNLENKKGYFETYLIPVKDNNGDVNAILWIVHDLIGEYQLAQQQRKAIHILESINEAYLEVDYSGKVCYMNSMAEKYLSLNKEEVLGNNILTELKEILENEFIITLKKAIDDKADMRGKYFENKTGKWIFLSCTCTIDSVIVLFYDIPEVKTNKV